MLLAVDIIRENLEKAVNTPNLGDLDAAIRDGSYRTQKNLSWLSVTQYICARGQDTDRFECDFGSVYKLE